MQPEQKKSNLLTLLKETRQSIDTFYEQLTPEERERPGTIQVWQAKDIVIHTNEWCKLFNQALADILQGKSPHLEEKYQAFNDQRYEALKHQSWEDTFSDIDATYRQLFTLIDRLTPEELGDPTYHEIFKGQTLLSQLVGYYISHPQYHLADYEVKNGRGKAAIEKMLHVAESVASFDDSPQSKGSTLYNVACFFCMMDQVDDAIAYLKIAFENAPDLKPWAKEDADLEKIHQDKRFLALLEAE